MRKLRKTTRHHTTQNATRKTTRHSHNTECNTKNNTTTPHAYTGIAYNTIQHRKKNTHTNALANLRSHLGLHAVRVVPLLFHGRLRPHKLRLAALQETRGLFGVDEGLLQLLFLRQDLLVVFRIHLSMTKSVSIPIPMPISSININQYHMYINISIIKQY